MNNMGAEGGILLCGCEERLEGQAPLCFCLQVSLAFLISGLVILGYCSSISQCSTYQGVVKAICGPTVGRLCEICFVFNVFMISIAFLVVVEDQLSKLCDSMANNATSPGVAGSAPSWYTDRRLGLTAVSLLIILPLSVPEELGFQKYISILGTCAATYLTILVVVKFYLKNSDSIPEHPASSVTSWTAMFTVVPTICFGFQCHEASVAIYSSMQNRTLSHWVLISSLSMLACLLIYSVTGVYGYWTFGTDVAADILMSYPDNEVLIIIGRMLFGISIVTIYPIILHLGRSVVEELCVKIWSCPALLTARRRRLRVLLTSGWVLLSLGAALFVPDISEVIGLIGGISAFFIFIFPGLCLLSVVQREPVAPRGRWGLIPWAVATILCGVFILGQSSARAAVELMERLG
ncbi:putative sodium-coupled neutral amino acid transporter 8a [Pristis pectinata]|uniref:putative sodium-coupled neutral amino acid transporter 8a n=1 Tax=Pristis pectinata TaxID=685728 RepID=UPI00223CA253|nr:putative sodium-coupled neutral amino acid transporter 8a [Pristis pectinata]